MKSILTSEGVLRIGVGLVVIVGLVGGAVFLLAGANKGTANHEQKEGGELGEALISVKTVRPHYDKTFSMDESRPANVLAYYRDDLESRVPGVISWIETDVGDVVKKGDVLIKIDVPELAASVKEGTANLHLARAQIDQMAAALDVAKSKKDVVVAKVEALKAKHRSDQAYYKFRVKQASRYEKLSGQNAITAAMIDEQEDQRVAAFERVNASEEAIHQALAETKAADAAIKAAAADLDAAKRNEEVKQANLDHAQAEFDFATIKAPFDGMIVDRNRLANVGAIVQKADNGNPKPLLSIQRTDIVTVVINVPDNFATYVTRNTEAIFETTALPGVKFHGKVTRFPNSLDNPRNDRTMPVEVDLWNNSKEEFERKKNDPEFLAGLRGLRTGKPGAPDRVLPIVPDIQGTSPGRQVRLLPGMFGNMTLLLSKFENVHLLPVSTLVLQGGGNYIYLVQDGKAHLQPVKVLVDDGKLVKVELLNDEGQVIGDLTGKEEVVVSGQSELSEGQAVKSTIVTDWKSLETGKKK